MGEHIYLELGSTQVQDMIEAMTEQIEMLKRSESYYKAKYEVAMATNKDLNTELADAKNLAEAAVAACRYPPTGIRGCGVRRRWEI